MTLTNESLTEKLGRLKSQRRAVILAHNYQRPEVQDAADYVGRFARPLAAGGRGEGRGHPLLRRGFHGGDRRDPLPGQEGSRARSARRLPDGEHGQRARAPRAESAASSRARGLLRQQQRGGEGRERHLLHLGQRRPGRPQPAGGLARSSSSPTSRSGTTPRNRPGGNSSSGPDTAPRIIGSSPRTSSARAASIPRRRWSSIPNAPPT